MNNIYEICFYGGLILAILLFIAAVILFIVLKIPRVFGELTGRSAKKGIQNMKKGGLAESDITKREQAKYYNQTSGKIKARETVSDKAAKGKKTADKTDSEAQTAATADTEVLGAESYADADITEVLGAGRYAKKPQNADTDDDGATETLGMTGSDDNKTTEVYDDDEVTAVLTSDDDEVTAVLTSDDEATAVLTSDDDEGATAVLNTDNDATEVLTGYGDDADGETTVLSMNDDAETTVLTGGQTGVSRGRAKIIYNVVVTNTNEKI